MDILCLILFLSVVVLWFFDHEYDTIFGVYAPTCAMSRKGFCALVFAGLPLALWASGTGPVKAALADCFPAAMDAEAVVLVILSSLIVLMILKAFEVTGSVVYAVLGALAAYGIVSSDGFTFRWGFALSFIAAPFMAFLLSAGIMACFRMVLSRVRIHMITMSYYMRFAVVLCVLMTVFALGLNWGGLLCGVGGMIAGGRMVTLTVIAAVVVIMSAFMHFSKEQDVESAGLFSDFTIYAVVSVGFAAAVSMIFFSFGATTSLIGLSPVPLSVSSLVVAAVVGVEAVQKTRLFSSQEYVREGIAFAAAPSCSFVVAYVMFNIVGGETADHMVDFMVMAAMIMILIALSFAGYVRRQRIVKEATERLVYTQQQQIYENSRALNDMELKVVLSENQALHNAVEMKKQEVMNVALSIVEQKEYLESLNTIVKKLAKTKDERERDKLISELSASLRQRLSHDREVDSQYFYAQAESLHEDFNAKLAENFPDLTPQERRLSTLLRLGFSSKYIATLMNITPKSVEISRYRLRQKLGLSKGDNLVNYIKSI